MLIVACSLIGPMGCCRHSLQDAVRGACRYLRRPWGLSELVYSTRPPPVSSRIIKNVFCRRYIHETASQACCFAAREGTRELIISEKLPTVKQSAYLTHDVLSIQSTSRNFLVGGLLIIGPLLENSFRLKGSFFNSSNHF